MIRTPIVTRPAEDVHTPPRPIPMHAPKVEIISSGGAAPDAPGSPGAAGAPAAAPAAPQRVVFETATRPAAASGDGPLQTALVVRQFCAWYASFQALHDIHLDIPECRVTAFIGPSGCGKSTFLRWINRMNDLVPIARATGTLDLHGLNLLAKTTDVVDLRRRVGMVFQKPNPFPKSIYENVIFGPKLHFRMRRSEMDDLVERSLQAAGLWNEVKDRLNASALGLSGGQQQRLCIARAIAVGPEVLLMDEPCSALDPKSTARVEDLIRELREQYTIIIVTHNMQQAARVSDITAFFYEGRLIETGETEQIFTNPRNPQTEDYVTGRFG